MEQFLVIIAAHFLTLLSPGPDFFLIVRTAMVHGWHIGTGACVGIALVNGLFITMAFGGLAVMRPESLLFRAVQFAGCCYLVWLGFLFLRHAGGQTLMPSGAKTLTKPVSARSQASPSNQRSAAYDSAPVSPSSLWMARQAGSPEPVQSDLPSTSASGMKTGGHVARPRSMGGRNAEISNGKPTTDTSWWTAFRMGFVSAALNPKNALAYASFASIITATQNTLGWKLAYGIWMFSIVLLWDVLVAFLMGNERVLRRFGRLLPLLERGAGTMLLLMGLGGLWLLLPD